MRSLKGHVDLVGLANVLQLLSLNNCEGVLTLVRGKERQSIHLSASGIRLLSSTVKRVKRLKKIAGSLLRPVPMTPKSIDTLFKKEKLTGWKMAGLFRGGVAVRDEDVRAALRQQVQEEVLDMFVWTGARFEFDERRPSITDEKSPVARLVLPGNLTQLLLEASRRSDELGQIRRQLPRDEMRLEKLPHDIDADTLQEDLEWVDSILPLVKTGRTLRGILRASIFPEFATMRAIHRLLTQGYIKVHDKDRWPGAASAQVATQVFVTMTTFSQATGPALGQPGDKESQ